ncbi:class III lanthionine synthetase LanKC [Streptomyces sp. JJ66]|uniref:class III lanthionine synthetase LanKC n=1 Tax=Streptomyces sp. JJ66 TaxID=2803843 RepID=UPI001C596CA7|nr:class III lanthionine synthetase LanKC [Streptomyces sp. JJ66]MBW1603468.1 class III lanthionine synthetase LanKC [Streptomyces sp. JJ66]
MDSRYEAYCLADGRFYETPDRLSTGSGNRDGGLETARRPVPSGWRHARHGDWLELRPQDGAFPAQGWKIHVSATLANADAVAARVWDYCVPRGIPFKFVPDLHLLHLRNAKYASRATSGKAVTVYPVDEEQLHTVLRELDARLAGEPGPYILTDLRWNQGPLYVRYGGFAPRTCVNEHGQLVPAIEDAGGTLIPDRKDPVFTVPAWVTLPPFLQPHLDARNASSVAGLPYTIERALHFSNGGGVYAGKDTRTGEDVVLKEGRPHAGLAADGADAVRRLEREKAALDRLAGTGVAPGVRDWFTLEGHRFLVMDYLPGQPLNHFYAQRHPLLAGDPDPRAVADYTQWALAIHQAVAEAVAAVHARGLVFNDLHMFNIMVAPDEKSVSLLDFEAAAPAADDPRQIVAHPGFVAPGDRRGYAIDTYALACLRLALFLPVTTLLAVDRRKASHLAAVIAEQFPDVPGEFLGEAVAEIEGRRPAPGPQDGTGSTGTPDDAGNTAATRTPAREANPPGPAQHPAPHPADPEPHVAPADWPRSRDAMVRAILASATPERDDRLFPGDIAQFTEGGGLGLAYGAAGVLYALAETGAPRYERGEQWLLDHTGQLPPRTPLGLYTGLLGVALLLDRLGHTERAARLVEQVLAERWQHLGHDLEGGLAGVGLALDHLGERTGDTALHDAAGQALHRAADAVAQATAADGRIPRAGLLHGATGTALLALRRYERTGESALLEVAADALRRDLARCVPDQHGALHVDEGARTMPYLGAGSVGIAAVLDDYLRHRPGQEAFEEARRAILPAARSRFYAQPGLFRGRAGMVWHLARTTTPGATPADLARQLDGLSWYGMAHGGGLAFPGDQMMRLSMDLYTGTAGCLLAVGAARHDAPVRLPFLPPLTRPEPAAPPQRAARPH